MYVQRAQPGVTRRFILDASQCDVDRITDRIPIWAKVLQPRRDRAGTVGRRRRMEKMPFSTADFDVYPKPSWSVDQRQRDLQIFVDS